MDSFTVALGIPEEIVLKVLSVRWLKGDSCNGSAIGKALGGSQDTAARRFISTPEIPVPWEYTAETGDLKGIFLKMGGRSSQSLDL